MSSPSPSSSKPRLARMVTEPAHINASVRTGAVTPKTPGTPRDAETSSLLDLETGTQRSGTYGAAGSDTASRLTVRSKIRKRVRYYIPGTAWIPNYTFSHLGGDVLAGLTVASMLIPQSVSYATSLAKMNPVTGLFSASIPAIIYAVLGSSHHLNVAPEAALSMMLGQAVNDIKHDFPDPDDESGMQRGLHIATIITLQTGLFSFLLGLFRLGFIDVVLSRALLHGFIGSVSIIIIIEQLIPMLGLVHLEHKFHPITSLDKLMFLIKNLNQANPTTTAVSIGALLVLIICRWIKTRCKKYWFIYRIPEVLVVVIVSTVLCEQFRWDLDGIEILGIVEVSTGGRSFFQFPVRASNVQFLKRTTSTAVLISAIGFLDSIIASKQAAARFGYSISPNRELVALGASNVLASFVPGTLPAYGSISRTRIVGDVGGMTQMASLVCSAAILGVTFFLLPWLEFLPKCVLASIICLIILGLLAEIPHEIVYYWKMGAFLDVALVFLTFALSMIWNIEVGIVVSMIVSLLLLVQKSSRTRMTILGRIPGTDRWKPINETSGAQEDMPGVLIVRIKDNLDFANTSQLKERLRRLELYGPGRVHPSEEPSRQQASVLVFHLADVDSCDASAAQIFRELLQEYSNRNVGLFITHLRSGPRRVFDRAGIMEILGSDSFQENVADAMAKVERKRRAESVI